MHSHRNTSAGAGGGGCCDGQKARTKAKWESIHVGWMWICLWQSEPG